MSPGRTFKFWWSRWDSNPRPPRCHRGALPTAPRPHRSETNICILHEHPVSVHDSSNVRLEYGPMAKLTFLGAAGCVTGSKYLVEAAGKRLLVDCGIFQGSPELQDRNYKQLPVDPNSIDYLVLTHAHLDHTGWLPVLVKSGYRGPIFANSATIELTTILLKDSAHLHQDDTLHSPIHHTRPHTHPKP